MASGLTLAQSLATSDPFYPTPWMTGQGEWSDVYAKARDFVGQLTLLEKVNLTTGVGWGKFLTPSSFVQHPQNKFPFQIWNSAFQLLWSWMST